MIEDPISRLISRWFRSAHSLKNHHFRKNLSYVGHPSTTSATPNGFGHPYGVTHRLCLLASNMNRSGNRPYSLMGYDTEKCKTSMSKTTTPPNDFQDVAGRKLCVSMDSSQKATHTNITIQQKTRTHTTQLNSTTIVRAFKQFANEPFAQSYLFFKLLGATNYQRFGYQHRQ